MSKIELYDKIFYTASENMKKGGKAFSFTKSALDCIVCKEPDKINVNEFLELNSTEYVEALYVRCLNGLPNSIAYSKMKELSEQYDQDGLFAKYIFLVYVTYSAEFRSMNRRVVGMNELRDKVISNSSVRERLFVRRKEISARIRGVIKRYFFIPMWKVMPEPVKKKIRRLRNRESV